MGVKSLQTQQLGVEVTGHNLANVNNPAYARQRINLETSITIPTPIGPLGTGADVTRIQQLRDLVIDNQLQGEISVTGFLEAQQQGLQYAQADLGQQIDRQSTGAEGAAASQNLTGTFGLAEGLSDLFSSFRSLSDFTNTTSLAERQVLLQKAQTLATQFNLADSRLATLRTTLDASLQSDVTAANGLLTDIAKLNDEINQEELRSGGTANDLRDTRQGKVEELAKLVKITVTPTPNGGTDISIAGTGIVSGKNVLDTLEVYDAGGGQMLVRTLTGGTPLALTGGRTAGTIQARDGAVAMLRSDINTLAATLITEVNTLHAPGFSLNGTTGANFFSGTNASDIAVNGVLLNDPALVQASGTNGAVGDNQVALALSQLADKKHAGLNNQTFGQAFSRTLGQPRAICGRRTDLAAIR